MIIVGNGQLMSFSKYHPLTIAEIKIKELLCVLICLTVLSALHFLCCTQVNEYNLTKNSVYCTYIKFASIFISFS